MWETIIDIAGYSTLTLAGIMVYQKIRGRSSRAPRQHTEAHVHMKVVPQDGGIAYLVVCHTADCDWAATFDSPEEARAAIHTHLTDPLNHP